jgi:hypothetical protein
LINLKRLEHHEDYDHRQDYELVNMSRAHDRVAEGSRKLWCDPLLEDSLSKSFLKNPPSGKEYKGDDGDQGEQ